MKINGQKIEEVNRKVLTFKRSSGNDITLHVGAVLDDSNFDAMCSPPEIPVKVKPGGEKIPNPYDPDYKIALQAHNQLRTQWFFITSIMTTPGLEFETIKMDEPSTWGNLHKELNEAGFSKFEISQIVEAVLEVNGLTESRVEASRASFLPSQPQA